MTYVRISFLGSVKPEKAMPKNEQQLKRTAEEITKVCDEVREMLLEKNAKYGDSALDPRRIFSKADAVEQIKVRIDDKLSRIEQMDPRETEDVEKDLIGYLVLLRIARERAAVRTVERKLDPPIVKKIVDPTKTWAD